MPPFTTTDRSVIRAILNRDRIWSVYALGDLQPGFFEHCEWTIQGGSLALVYRAFETPVLFVIGEAGGWLADAVDDEPRLYLHLQPGAALALEGHFEVELKPMWRMALDVAAWRPAPMNGAERLGANEAEAIERLYRDGGAFGESPDFYDRLMIEAGIFFGIRSDDGQLASVAGTHLVCGTEGVAAIGNVYTRRDRRGRGLAASTTSAVVSVLLEHGIRTIALNVGAANIAAQRVYQRLGFVRYCEYYEGTAEK